MPTYNGPTASQPTIDSEYSLRQNEAVAKSEPASVDFQARTYQQHHDYFVQKYLDAQKNGEQLNEKDMEEYKLAMLREKQGLVNPLNP